MKLRCTSHKRRVCVVGHTQQVREGIMFSHATVHRDDGSSCDGIVLRLGDAFVAPQVVAMKGLVGEPLRQDRLGYEKREEKRRQQSLS